MTTETFKPLILAPRCADNSTCQHRPNINSVVLIVSAVFLIWILLGFTIWHFQRISHLETEIKQLNKVILNMQRRLSLTDLDDDDNYGKENKRIFIERKKEYNEDKDIDKKDDSIDYQDYETEFDYEEFSRKLAAANYDDDINSDDEDEGYNFNSNADGDEGIYHESEEDIEISQDGDLFNDFSRFNSTRKKKIERKPRSIHSSKYHDQNNKSTIEKNTSYNEKELHKQQIKRPMHRLPYRRTKALEHKVDHKMFARGHIGKRYHRSQMDNRRYKNVDLKNAKSAHQIQATTNTAAAHFHLNRKIPDRYAHIKVDSYSGDMYIGHPSWSKEVDVDNYFKVENGILTVHVPGLYYVYAQVCYNNTHDQNGFVIFHGQKPFLQCLNTVPTNMPHKIHTCHTSGLIYLQESETIHLRDFHIDRNVILKDANNRSYFGLIKI